MQKNGRTSLLLPFLGSQVQAMPGHIEERLILGLILLESQDRSMVQQLVVHALNQNHTSNLSQGVLCEIESSVGVSATGLS